MGERQNIRQESTNDLLSYLLSWGLRKFDDEDSYYKWQRQSLVPQALHELQSLVEQRQGGANEIADIRFYDLLANPTLLPVLYSQRFDYFQSVGSLLSPRLPAKGRVLDFGCGAGILTSYFASQHPNVDFVGIDRSSGSIEVAQSEADKRKLRNVSYRVIRDVSSIEKLELFDCILSTQALFQSEHEPGLPSNSWETFQRETNEARQEALEVRTGLYSRLEALLAVLAHEGKLLCLEKTWNLGRRILFQRALKRRKLVLVNDPIPCSYGELGEKKVDGPLFEVSRVSVRKPVSWNEDPYRQHGETLYRCVGVVAERMVEAIGSKKIQKTVEGCHPHWGTWAFQCGMWEEVLTWTFCQTSSGFRGLIVASYQEKPLLDDLVEQVKQGNEDKFKDLLRDCWGHLEDVNEKTMPCYENHCSSAQMIYEKLPNKLIGQEETITDETFGKAMHFEVGTTQSLIYFYWANTFDQRQLVLVDEGRANILHEYYRESLAEACRSS